ncbi:hypothetical protein A2U01_0118598, partial [Trifolium medium]|nr:hypothetical protein [Trifolium medium]
MVEKAILGVIPPIVGGVIPPETYDLLQR